MKRKLREQKTINRRPRRLVGKNGENLSRKLRKGKYIANFFQWYEMSLNSNCAFSIDQPQNSRPKFKLKIKGRAAR